MSMHIYIDRFVSGQMELEDKGQLTEVHVYTSTCVQLQCFLDHGGVKLTVPLNNSMKCRPT